MPWLHFLKLCVIQKAFLRKADMNNFRKFLREKKRSLFVKLSQFNLQKKNSKPELSHIEIDIINPERKKECVTIYFGFD